MTKRTMKDLLPSDPETEAFLRAREILSEVAPDVLARMDEKHSTSLMEAASHSLSRIHDHVQHREVGFITAHRGEHTAEENNRRNEALKSDIRKAGYGFVPIRGRYIENKGTPEERKVHEKSFMVIGGRKNTGLKKFLLKHGEKYGQESVVHKAHDSQEAHLHTTKGEDKGSSFSLGKFHPNRASDYQSALKGQNKHFTFEDYFYIQEKTYANRQERLFDC